MAIRYILGTTENPVRWYVFDPGDLRPEQVKVLVELDLKRVPMFSDKGSAAAAAKTLGLGTWRYVRI